MLFLNKDSLTSSFPIFPMLFFFFFAILHWLDWEAAVHGVAKSRTRLCDFIFTFHFHALEKEMATHSSVLAWRIPGMGGAW